MTKFLANFAALGAIKSSVQNDTVQNQKQQSKVWAPFRGTVLDVRVQALYKLGYPILICNKQSLLFWVLWDAKGLVSKACLTAFTNALLLDRKHLDIQRVVCGKGGTTNL